MKIGVWLAISGERIIGLIFFRNTVASRTHVNDTLTPFFRELTNRERGFAFLQQCSATAHTADISMREIEHVFHERIISRGLWPARPPDMTPCDSYLWGRLKNAAYMANPLILEELKRNICDEINNTSRGVQRLMGNFIKVPKMYGQRRWKVPAPPS